MSQKRYFCKSIRYFKQLSCWSNRLAQQRALFIAEIGRRKIFLFLLGSLLSKVLIELFLQNEHIGSIFCCILKC